ncbi:MAG: hypothetical protein IEMM0008_0598 [bacterium]|nr:MAG: hypothetical protein IEMM0008_0598 [bacterium]
MIRLFHTVLNALLISLVVVFLMDCSSKSETASKQAPSDHAKSGGKRDSLSEKSQDLLRDRSSRFKQKVSDSKEIVAGKTKPPEEVYNNDDADGHGNTENDRLVIYRGNITMIVDSVKGSVKHIEALVKEYKGFIDEITSSDSYRKARIVLRVSPKYFEKAIKEITKLGRVKNKEISASDVTEEYFDNLLRLESKKRILARLKELLKRAIKPKERIKVLKEIERISAQIQTMEAQVKYLRSQADFSTITLLLETHIREDVKKYIASPFPWIRSIGSDDWPSYDVTKSFTFTKPEGFFLMSREYKAKKVKYLLVNPGKTAKIRMGLVKNYPKASVKFWGEALQIDAQNKKYKLIEKLNISSKDVSFIGHVYRIAPERIFFYAISVKDKEIYLVEGIFSNEETYKKNVKNLEIFLKSLRRV